MFAIVFTDEEGETRYWTAGDVFSISLAEAVVFQTEVDAGDTLPILAEVWRPDCIKVRRLFLYLTMKKARRLMPTPKRSSIPSGNGRMLPTQPTPKFSAMPLY